jgi:hypothetical protein
MPVPARFPWKKVFSPAAARNNASPPCLGAGPLPLSRYKYISGEGSREKVIGDQGSAVKESGVHADFEVL